MNKLAVADQDFENVASLFRLLSDKTRLNILMLLAAGERNVTSLCDLLELPQPTVSHHLGLLRMNNVIGNRRNGKQVFYMLNGRVDVADGAALKFNVGAFDVHIVLKEGKLAGFNGTLAQSEAAAPATAAESDGELNSSLR
jgi:DNA-binding transcriptional ArsR family regulator